MNFLTRCVIFAVCVHCHNVVSTPLPRPRPNLDVHVDLIDSIFQIPIQTLSAVGNLLKNVHNAKRNFLSININLDHPDKPLGGSRPQPGLVYPSKPNGYPDSKPDVPSSGFPDYKPDYNPVIPDRTSIRPVSGVTTELIFPEESKPIVPEYPQISVNEFLSESQSSLGTTSGGLSETTLSDLHTASTIAPSILYKPEPKPEYKPEPAYQRIPPAPAVQPPYTRATSNTTPAVQPLSIDLGPSGVSLDKTSQKEKNFKEYVQKKLAEKNLQDNRISHTF